MRNIIILLMILVSISIANQMDDSQIGRYQILGNNDNFVKLLILDTTNGDLFMRVNKLKKNKNLKLTTLIESNLETAPIGTYQLAHTFIPENFIDVKFLINTSNAQIYQAHKGKWVKEQYKENNILDN